jgi:hypothetical protein
VTARVVLSTALFCAMRGATSANAQVANDAQVGAVARASVEATSPASRAGSADSSSRFGRIVGRIPVWASPIASAAVPGLGQARLGQDRFVAYLATEAYVLLRYVKDERDGNESAARFRGIARDIARRNFVTFPGVVPPDSIWKYYESMEKYVESGFFSLTPNGPTVPETDVNTFNGAQWVFARKQFGIALDDPGASADPHYPAAVALYESRAVGQAYRWSWRNAQLEQNIFRRTISQSNESYRHATYDVIALIANHLLSSVDAFVTVRLQQTGAGTTGVAASIPFR